MANDFKPTAHIGVKTKDVLEQELFSLLNQYEHHTITADQQLALDVLLTQNRYDYRNLGLDFMADWKRIGDKLKKYAPDYVMPRLPEMESDRNNNVTTTTPVQYQETTGTTSSGSWRRDNQS